MRVKSLQDANVHVDNDVMQYGHPLERYANSHRKMYAFDMPFDVCSAKGGLVMHDSGIVSFFTRQLPWGLQNGRPVKKTKEYVVYIEEILELDY